VLVVQHTDEFRIETPSILTIGTFDGVHLGHQKILARLQALKEELGLKTVVLTFDPHPRKFLFPDQKDLKLLTLVEEKLELMRKHQVDVTVVYPFSKAFSQLAANEYVEEILIKKLKVQYLVIGYDHKFGKDRDGDIFTLFKLSHKHKFEVEEIPAKDIDSINVSSSRIRKALEEGDVELTSKFLGHSYFIKARVVEGKQLGRTIGYPTANLRIEDGDKLIPKTGVYFVKVKVGEIFYHGMMNIGTNPTTDLDNTIKLEVNIFDFNEAIYGKVIRVSFLKRLRDEEKFDSIEALVQQIQRDEVECKSLLAAL
jgi:riboflavin kinase / FMN adenylyltransferase